MTWLTLASIASLILVIGKAFTHQPSWLAVALYSVLLPSAWLASGILFTAAAKGIDQDQQTPSWRYPDASPAESVAAPALVPIIEEIPAAPVILPSEPAPAQVALRRP